MPSGSLPPEPTPTVEPRLASDSVPSALLVAGDLEGGWAEHEPDVGSFAGCVPLIDRFATVPLSGRAEARFKTDRTYLEQNLVTFGNTVVARSYVSEVFEIITERCKYLRIEGNVWRTVVSGTFPAIGDESVAYDVSIAAGQRDPFIRGRWVVFRRANAVVMMAHEWFTTEGPRRSVTKDLVDRAVDKIDGLIVQPGASPRVPPSPSSAPRP